MSRVVRCVHRNKKDKYYCGAQRSIKTRDADYTKHIDDIKCKSCGGRVTEYTRQIKNKRVKQGLCSCDGVHFSLKGKGVPHMKGSKWCKHYKGDYTDDDYRYNQQHCSSG